MDKTKEYINQCTGAYEIRNRWEPAEGDWFFDGKIVKCLGSDCWGLSKILNNSCRIYDTTGIREVRMFKLDDAAEAETVRTIALRTSILYNPIWLPTQDQLQQMIDIYEDIQYGVLLLDTFYRWSHSYFKPIPFGDNSMSWEQLWLAFIMKVKYNKIWKSHIWVK